MGKNGNIFVRKYRNSKPIKIIDEKTLDRIILEEKSPIHIIDSENEHAPEHASQIHTPVASPEVLRQSENSMHVHLSERTYANVAQSTPISIPRFPFRRSFHPSAINSIFKFKNKTLTNLNRSSVSL